MVEVGHFFHNKLGISERRIKTITWPEVAKRLHEVQASTRLCATRDLTEHDIILRIMRRDNYVIGMLNQGVLALHVPIPGLRGRVLFTQMLQWNIKACVDERRMRGVGVRSMVFRRLNRQITRRTEKNHSLRSQPTAP